MFPIRKFQQHPPTLSNNPFNKKPANYSSEENFSTISSQLATSHTPGSNDKSPVEMYKNGRQNGEIPKLDFCTPAITQQLRYHFNREKVLPYNKEANNNNMNNTIIHGTAGCPQCGKLKPFDVNN